MVGDSARQAPRIDLRSNLQCDADFLLFLSGAHMLSSALFSAVELGVFDGIEKAPTLPELAALLELPAPALDRLIVVMLSLGLVVRGPDGRLRNSDVARDMLTRSGTASLREFLLHQQRHVQPLFQHVSEAVRTGEPQTSKWAFAHAPQEDRDCYQTIARVPSECRLFLEAMNTSASGVGTVIARQVDFGGIRSLVDFGGGGGQMDVELAQAIPHLAVTIVDHAVACRFAETVVARHGLGERVRTVVGDFLEPLRLDGPFDAVLLGGILADWAPDQRATILRNAFDCLAPGGTLLVSETLLDETRDGPLLPALLSLTMLVAMRGENFTPEQIVAMLTEHGFTGIEVKLNRSLGVRDLVVAKKPTE